MDNPEIWATKNRQSREMGNEGWTIQRYGQLRMENSEIWATKDGQSRDMGN
jgi:hypothetical protein